MTTEWNSSRHDCPVDGCTTTFSRKSNIPRHQQEVHSPPSRCPFPGCEFSIRRKARLAEHVEKRHPELAHNRLIDTKGEPLPRSINDDLENEEKSGAGRSGVFERATTPKESTSPDPKKPKDSSLLLTLLKTTTSPTREDKENTQISEARPKKKEKKGCINCKNRRVKCDEEYPNCAKCIRSGRDCYYAYYPSPDVKQPGPLQECDPDVTSWPLTDDDKPVAQPASTTKRVLNVEAENKQSEKSANDANETDGKNPDTGRNIQWPTHPADTSSKSLSSSTRLSNDTLTDIATIGLGAEGKSTSGIDQTTREGILNPKLTHGEDGGNVREQENSSPIAVASTEDLDDGAADTDDKGLSDDYDENEEALLSPPLPISLKSAFITASAASQIVTNGHDSRAESWFDEHGIEPSGETALVTPSALKLLNGFLDQILFNFLAVAKSTSHTTLRLAVIEVLNPKLAKGALNRADQEVHEYLGGYQELDEELAGDKAPGNAIKNDGNWDLDLSWKRNRLRCMVYSLLGDMEEEDEDLYLEQQHLDPSNGRPSAEVLASPDVAIFLTSILEFMGEEALVVAGQASHQRLRIKFEDAREGSLAGTGDRVVVEESDMERIALDRNLGRLWRSCKKRVQSPPNSLIKFEVSTDHPESHTEIPPENIMKMHQEMNSDFPQVQVEEMENLPHGASDCRHEESIASTSEWKGDLGGVASPELPPLSQGLVKPIIITRFMRLCELRKSQEPEDLQEFLEQQLRSDKVPELELPNFKDTCERFSSSIDRWKMGVLDIGRSIVSLFDTRPALVAGKTRIEWKCKCGQMLWDDFVEIRPGAASRLREELVNSHLNVTSTGKATFSGAARMMSGSLQSLQNSLTRYIVPKPTIEFPIKGFHRCLFKLMNDNYRSMKGRWRRPFSLRTLASIKFVQFEMYKSELVDVRKQDDIPSPSNADYRYQPAPPELIPPVGHNHMMHCFNHPDHAEEESICLDRFPKKLRDKLQAARGVHPGWGLQFVEGLDMTRIWVIGFVSLVLGSLLMGILWTYFEQSIQDAFTVASYMIALEAATVGTLQALLVM
ncbi:hypothetical protein G7Y89_g14668 [Cudoniella acicularis]|uniref:Zn(2)-C6 fungal-type domain-containing protein n=1 Tax=Cudoniella acicularis TaxID=354080 RepID=A0A8H4R1K6_9HELO|nr:hypothetical protein G7Y89_g14668 [Cudoniella acicularis]